MGETYYRADIINSIFGDGVLTTKDRPLALTSALLSHVPLADVAPVRHGRWVNKKGGFFEFAACSLCGEVAPTAGIAPNYCPNCGAKMDLEG